MWEKTALTICGKRQDSAYIVWGQVRKVREDLIFGHSPSKVLKNVRDGSTCPSDDGLATSNAGIQEDVLLVVHALSYHFGQMMPMIRLQRYCQLTSLRNTA